MRVAVIVALLCLSACASDKLALKPPAGVDFSGQWRLNEEDSDDPLRLVQSRAVDPSRATSTSGQGGGGGQGGRGGGQGGRGGSGGFGGGAGVALGPVMPGVGALGQGLRWPGKTLEIKQTAGVVALSSGGSSQVYKPSTVDMKPHRSKPSDDEHRPEGDRPARSSRGDAPPPVCGWDDKTLIVQGGDPDDDAPPFEQRYSLSDDGQRLIEVVSFKGGRSAGFTMSRVWDRVLPGAVPHPSAPEVSPLVSPNAR